MHPLHASVVKYNLLDFLCTFSVMPKMVGGSEVHSQTVARRHSPKVNEFLIANTHAIRGVLKWTRTI